jgi:hypothetical protein
MILATGVLGKGGPEICAVIAIVLFVLAVLAALFDLRAPSARWFWAPLLAAGLVFLTLALLVTPGH